MNLQIEIPQELKQEIAALRSELADIKENFTPKEPQKYLSRKEVSDMFSVDISTVHNWTVKGVLRPYQIGGRVLYRAEDIEKAIIELKK